MGERKNNRSKNCEVDGRGRSTCNKKPERQVKINEQSTKKCGFCTLSMTIFKECGVTRLTGNADGGTSPEICTILFPCRREDSRKVSIRRQ